MSLRTYDHVGVVVEEVVHYWDLLSGMSESALALSTSAGIVQMKIPPSVPVETINCWFGAMATLVMPPELPIPR